MPSTRGQARKSLWIETLHLLFLLCQAEGQARKSLWIETKLDMSFNVSA